MSNPDKHKPLSAEELFKLLDDTSNKPNDFDEMDDFEKEALEGFSAHSNAQKAKTLTDELNLAIFKKAAEPNKGGTKNKVIWFSAAASIVLVIMISIFFFTQTKEDSATNIALNELKENEELKVTQTELPNPPEAISENTVNNKDAENPPKKEIETIKLTDAAAGSKKTEGESLAGAASPIEASAPAAGEYRSYNKPTAPVSEKAAKDESKNRNDQDVDDLKQQEGIVSDNLETKKKEKATISQEQAREETLASQTLNTVVLSNSAANNNNKGTKEEDGYYKADADKTVATKKSFEKAKVLKPVASSYDKSNSATETTSGKAAAVPSSGVVGGNSSSNAYYLGSELAIRDYILNYLKEKKSTISLTGTYKVKGNVSAEGKLKVSSIMQLTKVNCNCEDTITEALNTMIKWNPALEDGKKVSSNVEFTIAF